MAEMFCKATWGQVKVGDVVLMPWSSLHEVVEAEVVEVAAGKSWENGLPVIHASLDVDDDHFARWAFDPEATAYVRSRY